VRNGSFDLLVLGVAATFALLLLVPQLARLFGLASDEVTRAVKTLARARAMRADCAVDGWPGRWLIHGAAAGNARSAERS